MTNLKLLALPLWILGFALTAPSYGERAKPTLETSARALYLSENLEADLAGAELAKQSAVIQEELEAVFDTFVNGPVQSHFYQYEPFQRGVVSARFPDAIKESLEKLLDADGKIDATKPLGIPELDALNAKWKIQTYEKRYKWSPSFTLHFNPLQNPHPVADAFQAVPGMRYAVPNYASGIGGGIELRRLMGKSHSRNRQPPVYVLTIGWGDCPAGCMAIHRTYIQIGRDRKGGKIAIKIGETGNQLSAEDRKKYYK